MRSLVTTSLAAAVAAAGLASGWHPAAQASSSLWVAQASQLASQNLSLVAQQVEAFQQGIYMVEFNEPGLVERHQERQARSANPERFNFQSAETQADLQALQRIQSQHVSAIRAVGLSQAPTHYYLATHSGIAIRVESQAQLNALRSLSFVKSVMPDTVETIQTHRSATFVGADKIWDGTAVPGGAGTKGDDMIVAILDTGIDHNRPSFANDASCGLGDSKPKIVSRLDCSSTDSDGLCNGPDPLDGNGHGTHVASTAIGNVVTRAQDPALNPSDGDQISGIAPCARVRAYKVCATDSCAGSDIAAGMNSVLIHGDVTAMNFSISGGAAPWSDGDRQKLDLVEANVFVAAAAGNTRAFTPDPIGKVNHLGPWVMTVASTSHDRQQPTLDVSAGPDSANPPPETQGMELNQGSDSPAAPTTTLRLKRPEASNELGCNDHPAGFFDGKAALIHRGECTFVEKITKAHAAGAAMVIIRNNQAGGLSMNTQGQPDVPAYSIADQAVGNALADFVAANPDVAEISMTPSFAPGDVLSDFSLRGPTAGAFAGLTKPDIAAPGDSVYAAVPGGYAWLGGTSMASPQVTGGATLLRAVHPSWTPMEIKSALMMTAKTEGQKDGVNGSPNTGNWDADDVGNGRMDLNKAAKAGLVMNETKANFEAANPDSGGNPRLLNLPSMRNASCTPSCTWTRTVRNTLGVSASWTVEVEGGGKMNIEVTPNNFSFTGDPSETRELTIVATPEGDQSAAVAFGQVTLKEAADLSPDLHMTVAIKGVRHAGPVLEVDPTSISASAPSGSSAVVSRTLRVSNVGGADLNWSHDTAGGGGAPVPFLHDQPVTSTSGLISAFSTQADAGAITAADFTIAAPTTLSKVTVYGFDNDPTVNILATATALNWVIYPDAGDKPNGHLWTTPPHQGSVWNFSTPPTGAGVTIDDGATQMSASLDLAAAGQSVELPPGKYWLTMYPTMPGGLSPRWNWYGADQAGTGSMLIGPGAPFDVNEWTLTGPGGLNTAVGDVAFKLEGMQGAAVCDAAWLTIDPTSGTVAGGAHADITVKLNPTGLTDGVYTAAVCLSSNSGGNAGASTVVPVSFTVGNATPPRPEANLGINAAGTPESVSAGGDVAFLVSAANFGPDEASDVKVKLTLPNGMSFVSAAAVPASTRKNPNRSADRASNWSCSDNANVVTCEHDGNLAGIAQPLRVNVSIDPATPPGALTTTVEISAAEDDPSPTNNSATVLTRVVSTGIFSDGFEEVAVDPDLVDSGPVELILQSDDDKILNLVTGEFIDYSDAYQGGDINFYRALSGFSAYLYADVVQGQGAVSVAQGDSQIAVLQPGATVGSDSPLTHVGGNNMLNWHAGVTGYVGLKFMNEDTGEFNYGYILIETTGPNAYPVKITRYVYDKSGAAITIPTP